MLPPLHCNGCRACCLSEQIWLMPWKGDDPSLYETVQDGDKLKIKAREDGSKACRYLGPRGCTIYDKRPFLCRDFDCRAYMFKTFAGKNRQQRRAEVVRRPWLKPIFDAAKDRL